MIQLSNIDTVIEYLIDSYRIVIQWIQLSNSDTVIEYWYSYRVIQLSNSDTVIEY